MTLEGDKQPEHSEEERLAIEEQRRVKISAINQLAGRIAAWESSVYKDDLNLFQCLLAEVSRPGFRRLNPEQHKTFYGHVARGLSILTKQELFGLISEETEAILDDEEDQSGEVELDLDYPGRIFSRITIQNIRILFGNQHDLLSLTVREASGQVTSLYLEQLKPELFNPSRLQAIELYPRLTFSPEGIGSFEIPTSTLGIRIRFYFEEGELYPIMRSLILERI